MKCAAHSRALPPDDYGRLDALGTFLYIPRGVQFRFTARELEPMDNIRVPFMIDGKQEHRTVSHPGGKIFFLKEDSPPDPSIPSHSPFCFIAASIVTVTPEDLREIAIDVDDPAANSAHWPGIESVQTCPLCRTKVAPDGHTHYVLTLQSATMLGKTKATIAFKLIWRIFCQSCFESLAGSIEAITENNSSVVIEAMDIVGAGIGAISDPSCSGPQPAYKRTYAMIASGLVISLTTSMQRFMLNAMGQRAPRVAAAPPATHQATRTPLDLDIMRARCSAEGCGKSAMEASAARGEQLGEERCPGLLRCGGCRVARYCSKECQKAHWKAHKPHCATLKAQEDAAAGAAAARR